MDLKGKTALITGCSKRLGRVTALTLAEQGVSVVVHYRESGKEAEQLKNRIEKLGPEAWIIQGDFRDSDQPDDLWKKTLEKVSEVDFLINNAATISRSDLQQLSLSQLNNSTRVNAWVPFQLIRKFAEQECGGGVVNYLDTRIVGYAWNEPAYLLSKQLLCIMTKWAALYYAPRVTVNAVAPGLILAPPDRGDSYLRERIERVPLEKYGEPQEVARAAKFLLNSDFITGQVLFVDGGRHLLHEKGPSE